MIGFCSSPQFVQHYTGPYHPERPERVRAIYAALAQAGMLPSPSPFPDFSIDLGPLPKAAGKLLEVAFAPAQTKWVAEIHTRRLIDSIERICMLGGGVLDQGDTPVGPDSFEIAMQAVGAVLACCDAVVRSDVQRVFAAVRPPGHHAEADRSMGFCLFNNIAIAARYLQQEHGVGRVAIVDFDVHHGNGTQSFFLADPTVFYTSLHEHPSMCYPGTGYESEIGTGAGRGFTLNIPFAPGADDDDYLKAVRERVVPALDKFRPEFMLISAGFDAHREDPLAEICLSEEGFELITRALVDVADVHAHGRMVSALEGGYNLGALGRSVVRHMIGLGA